jgi:hypothetical protein
MTDTDRYAGGTYSNGIATFTNNSGGTFNVNGFSTGGCNCINILVSWYCNSLVTKNAGNTSEC